MPSRSLRKPEDMLGRNVVSLKAQLLVRRQEESPARGLDARLVRRLEKRLLERREHRLELLLEPRLERTLG